VNYNSVCPRLSQPKAVKMSHSIYNSKSTRMLYTLKREHGCHMNETHCSDESVIIMNFRTERDSKIECTQNNFRTLSL